MKLNDLAPHAANVDAAAPITSTVAHEVFQRLGAITRQLHDALGHLGVIPRLQAAAEGLPDARSRLAYIAEKTGDAAHKVLNSVDQAKAEHRGIADETRRIGAALTTDPVRAVASGALMNFVESVEASTGRIDRHLTDIMLAQDFHDLTGQVVAKVVALAAEIEDGLVRLLLQAAPLELTQRAEVHGLQGPAVDPQRRTDVVSSQGEVDELLASLGF